jgi:branched-chain amino acid transport system ATP-binding protein
MLLDVRDIKVHYGSVEAIKGVSLQVEKAGFVTLLGANGAGKTTILKTISGLKHPMSGEIWFSDQRIDRSPPSQIVKMGIGSVPEGRRIFPDMTVEDNMMLGAYVRTDRDGIKGDLQELYGHFPILRERKKQRAGSLSGGEQQMLAISRALMCKPRLLLMDEPSIGLSPVMVDEITSIITSINQQGIGVLLVEQNATIALQLSNRGYVIETGRIVLTGDRDDLLNNDEVKRAYLGR